MSYHDCFRHLEGMARVFSKLNYGEVADNLSAIATLNTSISFENYIKLSEHILYDYKELFKYFPEEYYQITKIFDYLLEQHIKQYNAQRFINARADNQSP